MGVSYCNYIGIYLDFDENRSVEVKKQKLVSPSTGREFKVGEAKFCPESGRELELVEHTITVKPEVSEKNPFKDHFQRPYYYEGTRILTLYAYGLDDRFCKNMDGPHGQSEVHEDIPALIEDFKKEYKKEIDHFRKRLGNFEIKYGVVAYTC